MTNAIIVVDLGWGDAGKGTTVDYLARQASDVTVVRFNGGCQAAHHVVLPGGRWHRFAQVGAGAFAGARTWLSRYMAVQPSALLAEMGVLHGRHGLNVRDQVRIDEHSPVTTPVHRAINRLRELAAGKARHGSCGTGYGETVHDERRWPDLTVRAGDFNKPRTLRDKFMALVGVHWEEYLQLRDHLRDTNGMSTVDEAAVEPFIDPHDMADRFVTDCQLCAFAVHGTWDECGRTTKTLIFEGAQGVMLDEHYGHHPHTTWGTTTPRNALGLLGELDHVERLQVLGVTRTHSVRHGPGPFPVESGWAIDNHNATGRWQGPVRAGPLDLVALKYAAQAVGRLDGLVMTHCDTMNQRGTFEFCHAYDMRGHTIYRLPVEKFNPAEMTEDQFLRQREVVGRTLVNDCAPVFAAAPTLSMKEIVESTVEAPVILTSHGPTFVEKRVEAALTVDAKCS